MGSTSDYIMMQLPKRLELKEMIQTSKNEIEVISEVRWKALAVISIIQFILLLDATVVNVALPHIKQDLGFTVKVLNVGGECLPRSCRIAATARWSNR